MRKEPLERLDSWPGFGHSSKGWDAKQKDQWRSAGFADKTSSHGSAKRKPGGVEGALLSQSAARCWQAGDAPNLSPPCSAHIPVLLTQLCTLGLLTVLSSGPDHHTISSFLWLLRPQLSGSDLALSTPRPLREAGVPVLAPSP